MTRARRMLLPPVLALLLCTGPAVAGPESCLTLDNNFAVAACANQYLPVDPTVQFRHNAEPAPPRNQVRPGPGYGDVQFYSVPPIQARAVDNSGGRASLERDVQRAALLNQAAVALSIAGGLGVIFGLWRWRASLVRPCKFCAAKLTPGSSVCRKCFRAV
jgi:hypothetical protein